MGPAVRSDESREENPVGQAITVYTDDRAWRIRFHITDKMESEDNSAHEKKNQNVFLYFYISRFWKKNSF